MRAGIRKEFNDFDLVCAFSGLWRIERLKIFSGHLGKRCATPGRKPHGKCDQAQPACKSLHVVTPSVDRTRTLQRSLSRALTSVVCTPFCLRVSRARLSSSTLV